MTWLFVTTRFPWPIVHGRWLRVYHLARALRAAGDDPSVLSFRAGIDGLAAYEGIGVDVVEGPEGRHIAAGPPRCWLGPYAFDQRMADAVRQRSGGFDVVVLCGLRMLQYAGEASSAGCVVADFVDDPVLERSRRGDRPSGLADRLQSLKLRLGEPAYERRFLSSITVSTFVSLADCRSFAARHPRARVVCVSNGVDTECFRRPEGPARPEGATIVFTGHMSNPNNERAAEFFVREVAPLIWRRRPDARVQLVGAEPTSAVKALAGANVEVTGKVEDIRPYLWNASVVVLPMRSGTGIKNKLLEAWAAGAAVVATPLACQGVSARDGENVLICESVRDLAEGVVRALADSVLRLRLGQAGLEQVEQDLTWPLMVNRLRQTVLSSEESGGGANTAGEAPCR